MGELLVKQVENHLDPVVKKWFAIYTRYKSEKQVGRLLDKKGIESYVPINRVVRRYTRKTKTVELPLLHCYVFVKITTDQYVRVLETPHVVRFIKFEQNLISIPQAEIDVLKKVCNHFHEIKVMELGFSHGQPVELIGGGVTGLKGKLVEDQGRYFVVELEDVGIGLRLQVEPHLMRPI